MKIRHMIYAGAIALMTLPPVAKAQDFYSGVRGPEDTQTDIRAGYDGELSGAVIPKWFGERFLLAAPFSVTESGVENQGVNVGYMAEDFSDNDKAILAAGLFRDGDGEYTVFNPQAYFTRMTGPWTLDLEGMLPTNIETGETNGKLSFTPGYGLTDRVRIGGSLTVAEGKKPDLQGIVRYELRQDHSAWVEGYVREDSIGIRVAINR